MSTSVDEKGEGPSGALSGMNMFTKKIASLLLSQIICVPFVKRPFQDLDNPSAYDMQKAVNVRIQVDREDPNVQIGAWSVEKEFLNCFFFSFDQ